MGLLSTPVVFIAYGVWRKHKKFAGFFCGVLVRRLLQVPRNKQLREDIDKALNNAPVSELDLDKSVEAMMKFQLPKWVKFSEYERAHWLNHILQEMWPMVNKAVAVILEDSEMSLGPLCKVTFPSKTLGDVPFQVTAIKSLDTPGHEVVLDLEVSWASMMDVEVTAWILRLIPVAASLKSLQLSASVRVVLKDLVSILPCFKTLEVSLLEMPKLDLDLRLFGVAPFFIPGIKQGITMVIGSKMGSIMVWPERMKLPIIKAPNSVNRTLGGAGGADEDEIKGQLNVYICSGKNLPAKDLFTGKSDPYVKVEYGEMSSAGKITVQESHESQTIANTLNPDWEREKISFIPRNSTAKDDKGKATISVPWRQHHLRLRVYDRDKGAVVNDRLGDIDFPLSRIFEGKNLVSGLHEFNEPLVYAGIGDGKHGLLKFEVEFLPFVDMSRKSLTDSGDGDPTVQDRCTADKGVSSGVLFITLHEGRGLKELNKFTGNSDPLVYFTVGAVTRKSTVQFNTLTPKWKDEVFEFRDLEPSKLHQIHMEVKDYERLKDNRPMGHVEESLAAVVTSEKITKWYPLQEAPGEIRLTLEWQWVS